MKVQTFTAVIHREDDLYVATCPELGTVSQGTTIEDALANLKEATELYLEEFPTHVGNRRGRVGSLVRLAQRGGSHANTGSKARRSMEECGPGDLL